VVRIKANDPEGAETVTRYSAKTLLFAGLFFAAHTSTVVLAGRLPGDTITNSKGTTLQPAVCNKIFAIERSLAPGCRNPRVIQTEIMGEPRRLGLRIMQWSEQWTINRCGTKIVYLIRFDFRGSVGNFKIEPAVTKS
jgi:hypothetical protein